MGLNGRLPNRDPTRGAPGRRPAPPRLPPDVLADARQIYDRLKSLGDRYWAMVEVELAKGSKRTPHALGSALKCWKEALFVAYRLGGVVAPEERDKLAEHLAKRPKVVGMR